MSTQPTRFTWTCPSCTCANDDGIDVELGPFYGCFCGSCGEAFDQTQVKGVYYE